jgi:beta-lactamase superfamily II metal-dependent hydrolase
MKSKGINFLIFLLLVGGVLFYTFLFNQKPKNLRVTFCDVGQGDAKLVQFSKDEEVLIDSGPNNSVLNCLGNHMSFYDRKISSIFLSHLDSDHIAGMLDILDSYEIGQVYISNNNKNSEIWRKIEEKIKEKNIPLKSIYSGQTIWYGNYSIETLWPGYNTFVQTGLNANDYSLVLKLNDSSIHFLFAGDIGKDISNRIVGLEASKLKSQILKIPHHGSRDFSPDFTKAVSPEISIISVGKKNRYGHPTKDVLDFLNINKFKYLRTDEAGDITIESDGEKWWKK